VTNDQIVQIRATRHEDRRAEALARVEAAEKNNESISTADLDLAFGSNPDGAPLLLSAIEANVSRKTRLWKEGRLTP
jgi:hypothetical protein